MLFKQNPNIQLELRTDGPRHSQLGTYKHWQYLGSVEVPTRYQSGQTRWIDLYVNMTQLIFDPPSKYSWVPTVIGLSTMSERSEVVGRVATSGLEWDWRQALLAAEDIVLHGWWSVINKKPLTP